MLRVHMYQKEDREFTLFVLCTQTLFGIKIAVFNLFKIIVRF
jgi:hypothetical protein